MPVRNDRLLVHGSRLGRPGPGEEMPSDGVELADVAPAEAAQERAEGRRRLDREAEDPGRAARSESPGVDWHRATLYRGQPEWADRGPYHVSRGKAQSGGYR